MSVLPREAVLQNTRGRAREQVPAFRGEVTVMGFIEFGDIVWG